MGVFRRRPSFRRGTAQSGLGCSAQSRIWWIFILGTWWFPMTSQIIDNLLAWWTCGHINDGLSLRNCKEFPPSWVVLHEQQSQRVNTKVSLVHSGFWWSSITITILRWGNTNQQTWLEGTTTLHKKWPANWLWVFFLAAGRDGDQRAPRDSSSTGGEKWEAMAAWTFWW